MKLIVKHDEMDGFGPHTREGLNFMLRLSNGSCSDLFSGSFVINKNQIGADSILTTQIILAQR